MFKGVVYAKLTKNVVLKSVSRSIYIREKYDFTSITIFWSIGVDSGPKLVAIIFTSAGTDVQKRSFTFFKEKFSRFPVISDRPVYYQIPIFKAKIIKLYIQAVADFWSRLCKQYALI